MKTTRAQLVQIIKEEARRLREGAGTVGSIDKAIDALNAAKEALTELMDTAVQNEDWMNDADDDSTLAQLAQQGVEDVDALISDLQVAADQLEDQA